MNWLTRENVILAAAVILSILLVIAPQFSEQITVAVYALRDLLLIILFPEAVVRSVKLYQEARIQIAQIQANGQVATVEAINGSAEDESDYNTIDRT